MFVMQMMLFTVAAGTDSLGGSCGWNDREVEGMVRETVGGAVVARPISGLLWRTFQRVAAGRTSKTFAEMPVLWLRTRRLTGKVEG
jgi:hypothetical protein